MQHQSAAIFWRWSEHYWSKHWVVTPPFLFSTTTNHNRYFMFLVFTFILARSQPCKVSLCLYILALQHVLLDSKMYWKGQGVWRLVQRGEGLTKNDNLNSKLLVSFSFHRPRRYTRYSPYWEKYCTYNWGFWLKSSILKEKVVSMPITSLAKKCFKTSFKISQNCFFFLLAM